MRDFSDGYSAWRELDRLVENMKKAINEKDEHWIGTLILNALWTVCNENSHPRVFAGGDCEFLFDTEEKANAMADVMELAGAEYINTGYYDPEEDERDGCVDKFTGKWYASWD